MARPQHRHARGGAYFVTTNTWERRPLFHKHDWAVVVEEKVLHYRDKGAYRLHGYVVMPDHIHVLVTPGEALSLERGVQYIKGGSSREIGALFSTRFPVWQQGFTEHRIRDGADYSKHMEYIDLNPVKARLAARPEEYPLGSAHGKHRLDPWPVTSAAEALS